MRSQYQRATTEGRMITPRRRRFARENKPTLQLGYDRLVQLVTACCAGALRGEVKILIRRMI